MNAVSDEGGALHDCNGGYAGKFDTAYEDWHTGPMKSGPRVDESILRHEPSVRCDGQWLSPPKSVGAFLATLCQSPYSVPRLPASRPL